MLLSLSKSTSESDDDGALLLKFPLPPPALILTSGDTPYASTHACLTLEAAKAAASRRSTSAQTAPMKPGRRATRPMWCSARTLFF